MKKILGLLLAALFLASTLAQADPATEKEITKLIMDGNAYTRKNLKDSPDTYSKEGALEFWSSGGLAQELTAGGSPTEYESFNMSLKYIQVITLVPGQAAVAMYYSEGSWKPKGGPAVDHYFTRATQAYVKEDGKWKLRASHWSPVVGGKGTDQTSVAE